MKIIFHEIILVYLLVNHSIRAYFESPFKKNQYLLVRGNNE